MKYKEYEKLFTFVIPMLRAKDEWGGYIAENGFLKDDNALMFAIREREYFKEKTKDLWDISNTPNKEWSRECISALESLLRVGDRNNVYGDDDMTQEMVTRFIVSLSYIIPEYEIVPQDIEKMEEFLENGLKSGNGFYNEDIERLYLDICEGHEYQPSVLEWEEKYRIENEFQIQKTINELANIDRNYKEYKDVVTDLIKNYLSDDKSHNLKYLMLLSKCDEYLQKQYQGEKIKDIFTRPFFKEEITQHVKDFLTRERSNENTITNSKTETKEER